MNVDKLLKEHGVPEKHHAALHDYYNHMTTKELYQKHGSPHVGEIRIEYNLPTRPPKVISEFPKIKKLYDEGVPMIQIAKEVGCHPSTIYRNFPNLTKDKQETIKNRQKMIQRELLIGAKTKDLAEKYGIHAVNVRKVARRTGINLAKWQAHEEQFIIQNYGKMKAKDIADKLGRTLRAVYRKSEQLREEGRMK